MPYTILTRKQAIMDVAIPQQMHFMVDQGYPPTWEIFSASTGWKQTIENMKLTTGEREQYEDMWKYKLEQLMKAGGEHSAATE